MDKEIMFYGEYFYKLKKTKFNSILSDLRKELDRIGYSWILLDFTLENNVKWYLDDMLDLLENNTNELINSLVNRLLKLNEEDVDIEERYNVVDNEGNLLLEHDFGWLTEFGYSKSFTLKDGRKIEVSYWEDGVPGGVKFI